MSRWRETMCGKVLEEEYQTITQGLVFESVDQTLSLEGKFLPHPPEKKCQAQKNKTFDLTTLHLPKSTQDVLISQDCQEWHHYKKEICEPALAQEIEEELEIMDQTLLEVQLKNEK